MGRSFELDINGADNGFIRLPAKSSARLSYFFAPQATTAQRRRSQRLLIFLSGIDGSKAGWQATISRLAKLSRNLPPMLAYDRYGIGDSDHDPSDVGKSPEEYHDAMDSMRDLRQLIIRIAEERLGYGEHELHQLRIVFCAHSLGCCIARLYSHQFPGTVEALLLVDSAIAGTRADKFTPDPDIPAEWEEGRHRLPKEATPQMCRRLIQGARNSVYSGNAIKTRERIKWSNMPQLLPFIDAPKLQGPEPGLPLVTVLMNDPDVSLKPISKAFQVPESLVRATWAAVAIEFYKGLLHIQGKGVGKGPIIAKGCGHNIPGDDPDFVARELIELLQSSANFTQSKI